MSLEDKNIDQLFRDAAANSKAPEYSPKYWEEMSAMLDAEQPQKRILLWWTFGGIAVATILLTLLFTQNGTLTEEKRYAKSKPFEIKPEWVKTNGDQQSNSTSATVDVSAINSRVLKSNQVQETETLSHSIEQDEKINIDENSVKKLADKADHLDQVGLSIDEIIPETSIEERDKGITETPISSLPIKVGKIVGKASKTRKLISKSSPLRLIAQIDLGVMENYETARPLQSGLVSASIKGEFEKSNVIIRSGIGLEISSNADLIVSKRAQFYSFGLSNIQTDLSYQNMVELFIPIEFGYRLDKTRFGIGLQANYLVNTTMEMNVYQGNNLISSQRLTGYNNGLNLLSGQGYLWMNHQLTSKLAIGAKIGTNLTKRFNDITYFNESAATNPIFGQLSLNYTLFE